MNEHKGSLMPKGGHRLAKLSSIRKILVFPVININFIYGN
jgi:hypothetical protein